MKNLLPVLCSAVLILFLFFSGCNKNNLVVQNDSSHNSVVITNLPNSFTFVVDASLYYYSQTQQLQINADTMTVAITVAGHTTGSGSIVIRDSSNSVIYQKDLGRNMVAADVIKISTVPKTVDFTLSNYTGKITVAIAGK